MAEQLHIFVSHSSQDKAVCDALVVALRRAGANVWYDEHNMGAGQLLEEIQREVHARPIFVVLLTKAAFASSWVRRETTWAFNLYNREPNRLILPVTMGKIEASDFNTWLFLEDFKRVEAPGFKPYPQAEAISRTLRLLTLTPAGEAPAPATPQPTESVDDLLAHGKALMAKNQYAEALPYFARATQRDANNVDAWGNLGFIYGEVGRWQESLEACDHAIALDDKLAWVWSNKGRALYYLRQFDEALGVYDRALALDPGHAVRWTGKGSALYFLKRYKEALMAFEHALTLDQAFVFAWNGKGNALHGLERHKEALAAYDHAVALDPDFVAAVGNRALPLRALGRIAEAEAAERRAKELGG